MILHVMIYILYDIMHILKFNDLPLRRLNILHVFQHLGPSLEGNSLLKAIAFPAFAGSLQD